MVIKTEAKQKSLTGDINRHSDLHCAPTIGCNTLEPERYEHALKEEHSPVTCRTCVVICVPSKIKNFRIHQHVAFKLF